MGEGGGDCKAAAPAPAGKIKDRFTMSAAVRFPSPAQ